MTRSIWFTLLIAAIFSLASAQPQPAPATAKTVCFYTWNQAFEGAAIGITDARGKTTGLSFPKEFGGQEKKTASIPAGLDLQRWSVTIYFRTGNAVEFAIDQVPQGDLYLKVNADLRPAVYINGNGVEYKPVRYFKSAPHQ